MTTPEAPDLESYADQREQARFVENQELARKLRAVTAELGEVANDRNRLAQENSVLHAVQDAAVNLTPKPGWAEPRKANRKGKRRVSLVAVMSDLHAAEIVRPEEMGDSNAYNLRITDRRLKAFFSNTIELAKDWFTGFEYDGIFLPLAGDLVSGAIHDELRETDELSVLDSTLWVAERILAGLQSWEEAFGKVHVISSPGNHGRDRKIPRYKGRSAHNADTHIARLLAMSYRGTGVTFDIPETIDAGFEVYSTRFNMTHGEEYQKNNPGTAEIGSIGPVKRGTLRASRAKQAEGRPFDVNIVAHYHQLVYAPNQGFIMNGSVKGYDEYARGLSLKPEEPQQCLFIVDPEHGCGINAPIHLMDRKAEGW